MTRREEFDAHYSRQEEELAELEQWFRPETIARTKQLAETESMSRLEREHGRLIWKDPIHEWVEVKDPLISDLIETSAFQRLWHVQQHGDRWAVASVVGAHPHTRAEHSLGTWHLVDRFGPDDPALKAAALLHDAGHTAFSHHGEFVFDAEDTQDWHEAQLLRLLGEDRFGVVPVLDAHGVEPLEVVANLEHPLLDFPKPGLCADRLDYIFRDALAAKHIDGQTPRDVLGDELVATEDYRWHFKTPWAGDIAQRLMLLLDVDIYKSPRMWEIKRATQALLLYSLEQGYVASTDITEGTDEAVLEKLWNVDVQDPELDQRLLELTELGLPRSLTDRMAFVMDGYESRFAAFDTQQQRMVDPLCGRPARWYGPEAVDEIHPLSYWQERGYDPNEHDSAKPQVEMRELPHLTPQEHQELGIPLGTSTATGAIRRTIRAEGDSNS
jgi:hypothetical protein